MAFLIASVLLLNALCKYLALKPSSSGSGPKLLSKVWLFSLLSIHNTAPNRRGSRSRNT